MSRVITNKNNIPEVFVKAIQVDNHKTYGDISVTQLIDAPQIRVLRRKNTVEEDAEDLLWSLFGTAMHVVLERAEHGVYESRKLLAAAGVLQDLAYKSNDENLKKAGKFLEKIAATNFPPAGDEVTTEQNLQVEVDGMVISGTMDRYTKSLGLLQDLKNCTTYVYSNPESRKKWDAQLNVYAFMLREHGYPVNSASVLAFFRNWSRMNLLREGKSYPMKQVEEIPIKLYDQETMRQYIKKRVRLHQLAEVGEVPDCTPQERWSEPSSFAIMRPGRKTAVRIFPEKYMADSFLMAEKHKMPDATIQERKGGSKRCEMFCPVKKFCPQYKKEMNELSTTTTQGEII